jgi:hypothetical protein
MGRRQCELEGCTKGGLGDTGYCKAHGGGKRCTRTAPDRLLTAAHPTASRMAGAGGASKKTAPRELLPAARITVRRMAEASGAIRRAVSSHGLLCGARRGQAVSRRVLHQGSCCRHGLLRGAWRGQTVPRGGLFQVSR